MFTLSTILSLILLFAQSTQTLPTTPEATGLTSNLAHSSDIPASTTEADIQELPSDVTAVKTLVTDESLKIVTDQAQDSLKVKTEISPSGQVSSTIATNELIVGDHSSIATEDSLEAGTDQAEGSTKNVFKMVSEDKVSDTRSGNEDHSGASETVTERKNFATSQLSEVTVKNKPSEATDSVKSVITDEQITEEVTTKEPLLSNGNLLTEASKPKTTETYMESTETIAQLTGSSFDGKASSGQTTRSLQFTSAAEKTTITNEVDVNRNVNQSESIIAGSAGNLNPTISVQPSNAEDKTTVTSAGEETSASSEQELSHEEQTVTVMPTEGSFTFILPDFHAQESSNSSMALDHHFNDTEWEIMGAAASSEDADEMFDDPCAYLSHRVEHLLSLNISKQAVQKIISDLKLGNFEEEKLPALKKILEVCLEEHEKADGEVEEAKLPPACRDLHQTVTSVCMATQGCKLEEAVKATMTHIEHLLTTESLHDALVMMRACADQVYHEQLEEQN